MSPLIEKTLAELISECRCDLLFEFGAYSLTALECPRVCLESTTDIRSIRGKNRKRQSGNKLTLIAGSASKKSTKSADIIFPGRFIQGQLSASTAESQTPGNRKKPVEDNERSLARYGITERFLFCVVTPDALNETRRLLKAYRSAISINSNIPDLVLSTISENPGDMASIIETVRQFDCGSKTKVVGLLSDDVICSALEESLALIYLHDNEDSREVLLTAMACGCAILGSKIDDIPQISFDSALYFDPGNCDDIAFKIKLISEDSDLAEFLGRRSMEAATQFSWKNTAGRIFSFFSEALVGPNPVPRQNKPKMDMISNP